MVLHLYKKLPMSITSKLKNQKSIHRLFIFSDTAPVVWTVDLKNGGGSIKRAKEGTAAATFTLVDDDAVSLF
jgi:hypothetical protein